MDFRERGIDFQEADRRYAELARQRDAGSISDEEFDAQRRRLMVQDDEGRWWAKSRKTGEWNYHDGSAWHPGIPPGYQTPEVSVGESTPNYQTQLEQGERLQSSQTTLVGNAPVQDRNKAKQRRGVRRGIAIMAGLVGVVALAGIGIIATGVGERLNPAPTYDLVEHDSGALSVEVPSDWKEQSTSDSEGEKGRNWSAFLGESAGPAIATVNDLDAWRNGYKGHRGMYIVASKKLAQTNTNDELVALGPNDYSSSCEAGARQDFSRPPYSGRMQEWNHCTGESDHTALTLAAAPEGRECVILLQIGGYLQGDEESIQHILDTFEADCSKID
jgi:hypothetical protein